MSKSVGTESGSFIVPDTFTESVMESMIKPSVYSTWLSTASSSGTPSIFKTTSTTATTGWVPFLAGIRKELTEEEERIVTEAVAEQIATGDAVTKPATIFFGHGGTAATSTSIKITGTFTSAGTFTLDETVPPDETNAVTWTFDEV